MSDGTAGWQTSEQHVALRRSSGQQPVEEETVDGRAPSLQSVCVCAQLSWSVWLCNRCIIIRERPSGGSLFGSVQPVDGDDSLSRHWLDAAVHTLSRSTRAPASTASVSLYSRALPL